MLEKFIKTYSGDYKYTTMVRHKGVVIAFAMDKSRRIWYTVLDLGGGSEKLNQTEQNGSVLDVDAWQTSLTELIFPNEIAEVGFGVAGQTALPVFMKDAILPEVEGKALPPDEPTKYDYFRSTTARFTEDAPFQVLSDGSYVYIFRQAIARGDASMVYMDEDGHTLVIRDDCKGYVTKKNEWVTVTGDRPLLVDATLLVDRFLLTDSILTPKMEVRYQRSRSKSRPASRKDSLGSKDLDGNVFYEPTQELKFIGNLTGGHFSVLLLPTAVAEVKRWQIFAENRITGRMDSFNVERSQDGLFNTRGSQTYTCANHPQIYARRAGTCSECGTTLIPLIVDKGYSESAMEFDGIDDYVHLGAGVKLGTSFTEEAWILPKVTDDDDHGFLGTQPATNDQRPPSVWVCQKRKILAGFGDGEHWKSVITADDVLALDKWNHVAVTFNGNEYQVYVNGERAELTTENSFAWKAPCETPIQYLGKVDTCFKGVIDEVRIWTRARAQQEILADMHHRLTGLEPDLVGYWRFDEGYGNTIHDQTNNLLNGTAYYGENTRTYKGIKWTRSDAPVGEHPGIERTSFEIKGRSFQTGPTSLLYYQQSKVTSGYSGEAKYLKNAGRVMLAVATSDQIDLEKNHIAALDFGVSATGRLAQIPDEVELAWVNAENSTEQSLNDDLDRLNGLQTELLSLNEEISRTEVMERVVAILEQTLHGPVSYTEEVTDDEFSYLNESLLGLRQAGARADAATATKQMLDDQLAAASVVVFAEDSYQGLSLGPFTPGYVEYSYLRDRGFNDRISSIQLQGPIEVVVYEHENRGGARAVFPASIDVLDPFWKNKISGMDIQERADFKAQRIEAENQLTEALRVLAQAKPTVEQELTRLNARLEPLKPKKATNEARRATVKADLLLIESKVKSDAYAIMPHLHTDPLGLTSSAGLLGFAWTDDAPLLFDSATGKLALYFHGKDNKGDQAKPDNQFFVTYYDTFTERASIPLHAVNRSGSRQPNAVTCFARSTDFHKVTVDVFDEPDEDVCRVEIKNAGKEEAGEIVEIWNKVPRLTTEFAKVLNGQATGHTYVGSGLQGRDQDGKFVALDDIGARRGINTGATLMVGDRRITVKRQVFPGSNKIYYVDNTSLPDETLPVFFIEYDYAKEASCKGLPAELSNGSTLIRALAAEDGGALITSQEDCELVPTLVCRWTAAAPGSTLAFDGVSQFAEITEVSKLKDLDAPNDLTLEAWVCPSDVQGMARIIQNRSGDSQYTLGLVGHPSAFRFDGDDDYLTVPQNDLLNIAGAITIEAWIKPEAIDGTRNIVAHGYPYTDTGELVLRMEDDHYEVGVWALGNYLARIPIPVEDGNGSTWVHLAGVYDDNSGQWILYRNGIAGATTKTEKGPYLITADWGIGANADPTPVAARRLFKGAIDEVRIWKRARTQQEIQMDMDRQLNGDEAGLIGYWCFENGEARDYSPSQNHGTIHGQPTLHPCHKVSVLAGVGEKFVQSRTVIPVGNWTHLAAVYERAYCLQFNGTDGFLDCGNAESLNINGDMSIEVSLQVDDLTANYGILSRGKLGWPGQKVPYALSLNADGQIEFVFEDVDGNVHTYKSDEHVQKGKDKFNHVMVTRKRQTITETIPGDPPTFVTRVHHDISMFINSSVPKVHRYDGGERLSPPDIGRSDMSLEIGRASACPFTGLITEARIWSVAREASQFGAPITGTENGLVSWWRFQERKGIKTNDAVSANHADLKGNVEWVVNPNSQDSSLNVYINGDNQINTLSEPKKSDKRVVATQQFTLGARKNGRKHEQYFRGVLEEVRIWQTARTEEQIQDNLFRRIPGEKEDLIAYYTFDAETGNTISDYSLRGNDLKVKAGTTRVFSTAPIGEDTPQVRSALAGIRTPFSGQIGGTPSVQEYSDMQFDSRGNLIGAFKRCYSFILNGKWKIITGYKVGDMVTEWIGQVQFAPELIGFIEGAPPVPGENLVADGLGSAGDYNEASTVELVEADKTTNTYASSRDKGFDMSVGFKLGFMIGTKANVGFGLVVESVDVENIIGLHAQFDHSLGWLDSANTSAALTTGKNTALTLRGYVAAPDESEDGEARRFLPENMGLALVKSETADVFALRLRHNGALIAYHMSPNPDIPKDWNLIHFPINPRYTKQGTLDGKIGLSPDSDYPNALMYNPNSSYFKPIEAYALKDRIKREEMQLQAKFDEYEAGAIGRRQKAIHFSEGDLATGRMIDKLPNLHKHNLINTYVWTADGGLFAETEETMDSRQEMIGGSYSFKGMAGLYTDLTLALFKIGAKFEADAMFGGHLNLNVTKTQESSSSFQMNVSLDNVERDIYLRNKDGSIVLETSDLKHPKPRKEPGKVDAYRFMSFYLEPLSEHFDDFFNVVVDPIWFEQSDDPGAVALRDAQQNNQQKKPAPWRVLHRVTYVSRVLPQLDLSAPPSLEKSLQTLEIDSNYELIRLLEPYVRDKLSDFAKFSAAVDEALENYLPELIPHKREIKEYLSLYYGLEEGYLPEPQVEGFGETAEFRSAANKPPVVRVGQGYGAVVPDEKDKLVLKLDKATVTDDRLDKTEDLFLTWTFLPNESLKQAVKAVAFDDPHTLHTGVDFTQKGQYRLRLTASDGILSASDETILLVNERPIIESITAAKPKRKSDGSSWDVELTCTIQSGFGSPSADQKTQCTWSFQPNGAQKPEDVHFSDPTKPNVAVTFQKKGQYQLRLDVTEGELKASREITIGIDDPPEIISITNGIPECRFENDTLCWIVELNSRIQSGLGNPNQAEYADKLRTAWEVVNGDHNVVINIEEAVPDQNDASILDVKATATFQQSGVYQLRFTTRNESFDLEATSEISLKFQARVLQGLQALYMLENGEDAALVDISGMAMPLDLVASSADAVKWTPEGVKIQSPAVLSAGARRLTSAIKKSNAVTLEAWIKPPERYLRESNPPLRRILTESSGPAERNFILAQRGKAYHVGLRTTDGSVTDENASLKSLEAGIVDPDLTHIAFTRDANGNATLYKNGEPVSHRTICGDFSDWNDDFQLVLANEFHSNGVYDRTWSGEYHLIAIYNRALSAEEVKQNFSFGSDRDRLPHIFAGENRDINWSVAGVEHERGTCLNIHMPGRVIRDSVTDRITVKWEKVSELSSPGQVTFAEPDHAATDVDFSMAGKYVLRLTASGGEQVVSRQMTVNIFHEVPIVKIDNNDRQAIITGDGVNTVTLANGKTSLHLNGAVRNSRGDDYPRGKLEVEWTCDPDNVTFDDVHKIDPVVTFTKNGIYVLTLTARNTDEPDNAASESIVITVNEAPIVDAGPDQVIILPRDATLDATVSDDGLPDHPGILDLTWTAASKGVIFEQPKADYTSASFSDKGTYALKLSAFDGAAVSEDEVTVIVNKAPVVDAGQDATVKFNEQIDLIGIIEDDGFGNESQRKPINVLWEMESGPEQPVFTNPNKLEAEVNFLKKGIYKLKITATTDYGTGSDTIRFTVNQPPKVSAGKDQTVSRKESIELMGQIIDNGLGDPERDQDKLSIEWEGPHGFTLENKSNLETTVTIPKGNQKGKTCEFQLTVTNPSFAASETVTVKLE